MSSAPRYGTVDREYGMHLATIAPDDDCPIWMVNLMKYREVADYGDAHGDRISGREADDRYAPLDVLASIGAEVVFHGDVDQQLLGDGTVWDRVGIVRYPTRRSFIEKDEATASLFPYRRVDVGKQFCFAPEVVGDVAVEHSGVVADLADGERFGVDGRQ